MRPHFDRAPSPPRMKFKTKEIEYFLQQVFGDCENDSNAIAALSKATDKTTIKNLIDGKIASGEIDVEDEDTVIKLVRIDRKDYLRLYLEYFWVKYPEFNVAVMGKALFNGEPFSEIEAKDAASFMVRNKLYSDVLMDWIIKSHTVEGVDDVYNYFLSDEIAEFSDYVLMFSNFKDPIPAYKENLSERIDLAHRIVNDKPISREDMEKATDLLISEYTNLYRDNFEGVTDKKLQLHKTYMKLVKSAPETAELFNQKLLDLLKADNNKAEIKIALNYGYAYSEIAGNNEFIKEILDIAGNHEDALDIYRFAYYCKDPDMDFVVEKAKKYGIAEEELIEDPEDDEETEDEDAEQENESEEHVNPTSENESETATNDSKQAAPSGGQKTDNNKEKRMSKDARKKYVIKNEKEEINETPDMTEEDGPESFEETAPTEDVSETGRYICAFEIKETESGMKFRNFRPLAQVRYSKIYALTTEDYEYLIPKSERRNINLRCSGASPYTEKADQMIYNGSLVVVDFKQEDLEDNINPATGLRNATGYKISCDKLFKEDGIHTLEDCGIYRIVKKKNLRGDVYKDKYVYIDSWYFNQNVPEKVYIDLGDVYAGPYDVRYRVIDSEYFIMPDVAGKAVLSGYGNKDASVTRLYEIVPSNYSEIWRDTAEEDRNTWIILNEKQSENHMSRDLLEDKALIEAWLKSKNDGTEGDIPFLTKVPQAIAESRLKKIEAYIHNADRVKELSRSMDDTAIQAIFNSDDDERVKNYVSSYIGRHQDLISNAPNYLSKVAEIGRLKAELDNAQEEKAAKIAELEEALAKASKEEKEVSLLKEAAEKLDDIRLQISKLDKEKQKILKEIEEKKQHHKFLSIDCESLEEEFNAKLAGQQKKMLDLNIDGYIASKMAAAAASWEEQNDMERLTEAVVSSSEEPVEDMEPQSLVEYLVGIVHKVRPKYSANDIINIVTCISQGFLTVFSGAPGAGKTSICNIISDVLGLKSGSAKRYIPVSVEKGWVSKRDFVGYFNPLTGHIDRTNANVFDALRQLDIEKKQGIAKQPYVILLDEANLSPMEYYWADFMNVCDGTENSVINLGENHIYEIPETLRFVATVNNDHTTEVFSPRLLDRAWIITLPRVSSVGSDCPGYTDADIKKVSWSSIRNTFRTDGKFTPAQREIFDGIQKRFRTNRHMYISPRSEMAVQHYCSAATPLLKEDAYGNAPEIVAIDYAISQKVFPKISGQGEEYEKWLNEVKEYCDASNLSLCSQLLTEIIANGNASMKYYQFF